jgi:hypothetical protein
LTEIGRLQAPLLFLADNLDWAAQRRVQLLDGGLDIRFVN